MFQLEDDYKIGDMIIADSKRQELKEIRIEDGKVYFICHEYIFSSGYPESKGVTSQVWYQPHEVSMIDDALEFEDLA